MELKSCKDEVLARLRGDIEDRRAQIALVKSVDQFDPSQFQASDLGEIMARFFKLGVAAFMSVDPWSAHRGAPSPNRQPFTASVNDRQNREGPPKRFPDLGSCIDALREELRKLEAER
jgi:hypothetical protein